MNMNWFMMLMVAVTTIFMIACEDETVVDEPTEPTPVVDAGGTEDQDLIGEPDVVVETDVAVTTDASAETDVEETPEVLDSDPTDMQEGDQGPSDVPAPGDVPEGEED